MIAFLLSRLNYDNRVKKTASALIGAGLRLGGDHHLVS